MEKETSKKIFGIFLALFVIAVALSPQMRSILTLPTQKKIMVGERLSLPLGMASKNPGYISYELIDHKNVLSPHQDKDGISSMTAKNPGQAEVEVKLFGAVPLKHMVVDVLPELRVIPSGESIGILLKTNGVIVVGHAPVIGQDNQKFYPAKMAGVEEGDYILKINNQNVQNDVQAAKLIDEAGKSGVPAILEVRRGDNIIQINVYPVYCKDSQTYRIGLYIRDNTAGIGTLTFYDPGSGKYGALGHLITDGSKNKINLDGSKIVKTFVQNIKVGRSGEPGEKVGVFADDGNFKGNIEKNTKYGIFGTLNIPKETENYTVPIALANEVKTGPAKIYTVLQGNRIDAYDIEILRVMPDNRELGKGMVISITDQRLLAATGGIIQGMSGSPIIQNGKLVGAVTHVFVNDPTRGYGCMAEWMLQEAGLLKYNASLPLSKNLKKAS